MCRFKIINKKIMDEDKNEVGKFLDPNEIIAQLNIEKSSVVADFGCGPGFFSIPFAKAVGEDGKVYAFDVLPQMLEAVTSKAKNSGVSNIIASRVNVEKEKGSKLENDCVDWIIMKDILFQNQNKDIIITEAYRILKPGGRIFVAEWNQNDHPIGPEQGLRIDASELKKMFTDKKFSVEKDIEAGHFHYAFVVVK
jgi:ubiquinone/menaquinone biosynthesis C-methylase UbiE